MINYLKKIIVFTVFCIMFAVVPVRAETIILNGKMIDNRMLVPLRSIFVNLGASVEWDANSKSITGIKDDVIVNLKVNQSEAYLNDNRIMLDVPASVFDGSTYVPLRFIAESLGANVSYDSSTRTATIRQGTDLITVKNSTIPTKTSTGIVPIVSGATSGKYLGSIESDKYHYPTCRWAEKILSHHRIWFKDEAAAKAAGYVPCGVCEP